MSCFVSSDDMTTGLQRTYREGWLWTTLHACRVIVATVAFFLALERPVYAWITLGTFDWDPNPGAGAFTSEYGWSTVATPSSGGNTGGWLQVTFASTTSDPPDQWFDVVHAPATNLFAGAWTTNMWLTFDFWESNVVAGAVQVRWQSSTNDFVWRYSNLTPPDIQTWGSLTAPFMYWQDWQAPGATEAQYLADLQTIDWIGVYIYRNTQVEQVYGVDNMRLMIPEPAECFMLAAAVISSGMSLRRRRRKKRMFTVFPASVPPVV